MKPQWKDILKQAQAMQTRLTEIQEEVAKKTVEATAGGGMVRAVVNGRLEVVELHVEQDVFESGDREMLQDLVVAAVNQGIRKAQEMVAAEMAKVTGGLKIPGFAD
ncbi:MAG: nucleoid-associated protein, YbaB/EbfC family [Candidatus Binatia bacterium]|nr:MAG: nucleoid-associated protein, YbaB/EbfC family [Candidatus Binatia bacterium]